MNMSQLSIDSPLLIFLSSCIVRCSVMNNVLCTLNKLDTPIILLFTELFLILLMQYVKLV